MGIQPDDASVDADAAGERETRSVELPTRIVDRIERRVDRTDFESPTEYVTFVLEEILARVDELEGGDEGGTDDSADDVTEEQVRSRLESLGYLE